MSVTAPQTPSVSVIDIATGPEVVAGSVVVGGGSAVVVVVVVVVVVGGWLAKTESRPTAVQSPVAGQLIPLSA
jgi:hypothetical protein